VCAHTLRGFELTRNRVYILSRNMEGVGARRRA
jgi:hypothetical protein